MKRWWVVPWSCPIEVRHSVRAQQPPITASLNQFQAPRKSRPFELLGGGGEAGGEALAGPPGWELRQSSL